MTVMSGALMQFAVAVAGAVVFFIAARLIVAGLHRFFGPGLGWVRPLLSAVDRFLVLRVSMWIGLSDPVGWRRWLRLVGVLLVSAAIGAFTPSLFATLGLIAGLVAVMAVFRRWAWDEEDRALGLAPNEKRAEGVEDFNDDAHRIGPVDPRPRDPGALQTGVGSRTSRRTGTGPARDSGAICGASVWNAVRRRNDSLRPAVARQSAQA